MRGGAGAVCVFFFADLRERQEAARSVFLGTGGCGTAGLIERGSRGGAKEGGATATIGTIIRAFSWGVWAGAVKGLGWRMCR